MSSTGPTPPRRGPRPGDRLPDAPITIDGQASTLHAATRAPTYHLLLCGPHTAWNSDAAEQLRTAWPGLITTHRLSHQAAPGVLHDPDGTALRRLGTDPDTPTHCLIRPDGHLAYRNRGTDLTGLHTHLTHWLTATVP
ncbi:MAG TPA: hypothetical protein VFO68_34060 [Actinophytocola sp.]|nr:hypothetical protein [Actinophytocola sp.]